jgi:Protein of unknown function (DUF3047)
MPLQPYFLRAATGCCLLIAALATGCANKPLHNAPADAVASSTEANEAIVWAKGQRWQAFNLPSKKRTEFSKVRIDGRDAVLAVADQSASLLRQKLRIDAADLSQVKFSWKIPQLIEAPSRAAAPTGQPKTPCSPS